MKAWNVWQQWRDLQPVSTELRGEVIAHHADLTSTIELPGGSQFRATGVSVEPGAFARVRDGEVIGEAVAGVTEDLVV